MKLLRLTSGAILFFVFLLLPSRAFSTAATFNMIRVHPNVDLGHYFYLQEAGTLAKHGFTVGTATRYDYRLLDIKWKTVFAPGGPAVSTQTRNGIEHLWYQYFYGAFGLTDRISFSLDFPLYYAYKYGWTTAATTTNQWKYFEPGDLWLNAKFNVLDIAEHPLGVALIPSFSIPTGKHDDFLGDEGVTGEGKIVIEAKPADRLRIAFNAAFQSREKVTVNDISFRDVLKFALGANLKVTDSVSVIGEVATQTATNNFFSERRTSPTEARIGANWHPKDSGLGIGGGAAVGLVHGTGAPLFAGFINLTYTGRIAKKTVKPSRFAALDNVAGCARTSADDGSGRFPFMCSVYYEFDKARTDDLSTVAEIAKAIAGTEGPVEIEIRGWADPVGPAAYNKKLSLRRAGFIKQQMMNLLGSQGERVTIRVLGIGEDTIAPPPKARRSDALVR